MTAKKQEWGSRVGLVLAMAGNSVGLGNFLRFPVQAIQNGGGGFLIPYLICFLLIGIPLLWVEWASGRFGGRHGYHATPFIFEKMSGGSKAWKYVGVLGLFSTMGVATYYCYIESWTISYTFKSAIHLFTGMSQAEVAGYFGKYIGMETSFLGIPCEALFFYTVCVLLNTFILSRGLSGGIEKVAKIGMPLLIGFGIFLAIRGLTLGSSAAPAGCIDCDAFAGLDFLFRPQFTSLYDPKVWLAAAGQIFFTLSVGMGSIQSYASFVKSNEDIALNSMSAGWMNEFVEVVIGSLIVIPLACGYLGLDWVLKNAGFAMAFQTMPFLFDKWGLILGTFGGVFWFGLLFFAGITSSLAMCTPYISFTMDEFKWSRNKASVSAGALVFLVGLPCVFFFTQGVFDEYDYWTGTISLFTFALLECILFGWVFGIDRGWDEINQGADIKLSKFFKPIIKYVTPAMLLAIFIGSVFNPKDNDWVKAIKGTWEFDKNSIIGKLQNKGFEVNRAWFSEYQEADVVGIVSKIGPVGEDYYYVQVSKINYDTGEMKPVKRYTYHYKVKLKVAENDNVQVGTRLVHGNFVNDIFYIDASRLLLLCFFGFFAYLVYKASIARKRFNSSL